jgi:hypothetical protein
MTDHRSLAAVRARLERAAAMLPDPPTQPEAHYHHLEEIAISILDSSFQDFREGELEEYLRTVLYQRSLELGLVTFPRTDNEL